MIRWLMTVIIVTLILSNGLLFFNLSEMKRLVLTVEQRTTALADTVQRQSELLKDTTNQLALFQQPPAQSPQNAGQPTPATRGMVSELALAQSYKIDRVVDWVGLIEEKIFFILFPPPDSQEKERQALDLRGRTEQIRADFQSVAQQERALRDRLLERVSPNGAPAQPQ